MLGGPERKVFDASNAPREEIDGVAEALREAGIDFFEIPNSLLWGGGAICVKQSEDYDTAHQVIDVFQAEWRQRHADAETPGRVRWILAIPVIVILLLFFLTTALTLF